MKMLKENFELALELAIMAAEEKDKASGSTESIFTAGLREVLKESRRGKRIEITSR